MEGEQGRAVAVPMELVCEEEALVRDPLGLNMVVKGLDGVDPTPEGPEMDSGAPEIKRPDIALGIKLVLSTKKTSREDLPEVKVRDVVLDIGFTMV